MDRYKDGGLDKMRDQLQSKHKANFSLPEGYFTDLTDRVMDSCDIEDKSKKKIIDSKKIVPLWGQFRGFAGLAASFVIAAICVHSAINYVVNKDLPVTLADVTTETIYEEELALYSSLYIEELVLDDLETETTIDDEMIEDYLVYSMSDIEITEFN